MGIPKLQFEIVGKDKSEKITKSFTSAIKGMTVGITAATGAATAMGVGLFAMTKQTAEAYDKIGKFSDRIGISTEALSEMQYVAELSGVKVEALNMGFQRMTRRIAEAAMGTGEAKAALEELGLEAGKVSKLPVDEQFMEVARALEDVGAQSDKVRLAMRLFDSEGVALLQTMKNGAGGIEAMRQEAEKFGLVVSKEAAAGAAEFHDSLTRLKGAVKGIKNSIAERLFPAFSQVFNKIALIIADNRELIVKWAKDLVVFGFDALQVLMQATEALYTTFKTLQGMFAGTAESFHSFTAKTREWGRGLLADSEKGQVAFGKIGEQVEYTDKETQAFLNHSREASQKWGEVADQTANDMANTLKTFETIGRTVENLKTTFTGGLDVPAQRSLDMGGDKDDKDIANETAKVERLKEVWGEYYLSQEEQLANWYVKQQEMFIGNEEALATLKEVYVARKNQLISDSNAQEIAAQNNVAAAEATIAEKRKKGMHDMYSNISNTASVFGEKGKAIAKAAMIPKAIADTKAAAIAAYNSMVGIPYVGPVLGAVAAAAAIAFGMSQVAGIRGALHGGLENVPEESTYLLNKGERVLSTRQNKDLTDFMEKGGGMRIDNFSPTFQILPNATNIQAMLSMDKRDWEYIIEDKIVPALAKLQRRGITAEALT